MDRGATMLELLQPTTGNLVSVSASGTGTADDYERVLIPAIEETLKSHDKVRLLFQLEPNTGLRPVRFGTTPSSA